MHTVCAIRGPCSTILRITARVLEEASSRRSLQNGCRPVWPPNRNPHVSPWKDIASRGCTPQLSQGVGSALWPQQSRLRRDRTESHREFCDCKQPFQNLPSRRWSPSCLSLSLIAMMVWHIHAPLFSVFLPEAQKGPCRGGGRVLPERTNSQRTQGAGGQSSKDDQPTVQTPHEMTL